MKSNLDSSSNHRLRRRYPTLMQRKTAELGIIPPPFANRPTFSANIDTVALADKEEFLVVNDATAASKGKLTKETAGATAVYVREKLSSEQEDDEDDRTDVFESIERVRTGSFFHYDDDQVHPIEWKDFVAAISRDYDELKAPEPVPEVKQTECREDKEEQQYQSNYLADVDARDKEAIPNDRRTKFRRAKERRRKLQERREKGKKKPFGMGLLRFKNKENQESPTRKVTQTRMGYVPVIDTPSKDQSDEFKTTKDDHLMQRQNLHIPLASPTEDLMDEIEDFLFKSKNSQSIDAMDQDAFSNFISSIQKEIMRTENNHRDDEDPIYAVSDDSVEEEMIRAVQDVDPMQATREAMPGPYDELPENQQSPLPPSAATDVTAKASNANYDCAQIVESEPVSISRISTMESFREAIDRIKKVLSEDKEKLPVTVMEDEEEIDDLSNTEHHSQKGTNNTSLGTTIDEEAKNVSCTVNRDGSMKCQHLKSALERLEKALSGEDTKNSTSFSDQVEANDDDKEKDFMPLQHKDDQIKCGNERHSSDDGGRENNDTEACNEYQQVRDEQVQHDCNPVSEARPDGIHYRENVFIDEIKSDITESVALSPSHGEVAAPNRSKWDEFLCWVSGKKEDDVVNKRKFEIDESLSPKRKTPKSFSREESMSNAPTTCSEEKDDFFSSGTFSSASSDDDGAEDEDLEEDEDDEDDEDEETTLASERYTRDRPLRVLATTSSLQDEDFLDLVESRCCVY